ncbi:hypothetical protein AB6A40_010836 [Gnathostoma spinigerum]|uniref:RuvB-like helicase n=1 Tax=Gnathostoma spinigerum TaxID=75299 RepID=A0ABD6F3H3_9BILA
MNQPVYFRSLIIRTETYSETDIEDILRIRASEESVNLEDDALAILTKLAFKTSLRYAMQLISTGDILRERRRADKVGTDDLKKVYQLFYDRKRSVTFLHEFESQFVKE